MFVERPQGELEQYHSPMKLFLENVRGFAGKHELNVKPLTVLVGENSSGKTTLLSALFVALQPDFPTADAFNRAPFELGSFDTIATYRGGKYGRAPFFSIGWESEPNEEYRVHAKFVSHLGTPRISEIEVIRGKTRLHRSVSTQEWTIQEGSNASVTLHLPISEKAAPSLNELVRLVLEQTGPRGSKEDQKSARISVDLLYELITLGSRARPRATALAPLRTRPHRTYDELIEEFKPEGDHVPLILARALSGESGGDRSLAQALAKFGKSAGLFASLKVRRMGRQPSDPFQVRVKSTGPDANLVDVGYGVSQALPVVVDSIMAPKGRVVLVQQPEVHLHPKAQAALGTFFSELAKYGEKRFVIETHSDYLVDRIRLAVSAGLLPPEYVNIAFLERDGLDVRVHELALDKMGNIVNAPAAYREFFLEEDLRLMFRGEDASDH